jgi:two-component system, NtrC family, nitrogen regulation response regulator GlnG
MQPIILATADEDYRVQVLERILALGYSADCCANWPETIAAIAQKKTRVLLLDAELPEVSGEFLAKLIETLPHRPVVRVIRGQAAPLTRANSIKQLVTEHGDIELTRFERSLIPLWGLGPEALRMLRDLAANPSPVFVQGEPGTGKEWIARLLHRLSNTPGPFVVVRPGEEPVLDQAAPGTVYLKNLYRHPETTLRTNQTIAQAQGWRLAAGGRPSLKDRKRHLGFLHVELKPLRERPKAIRPLAKHYLQSYQTRLGLPKRRITPRLWRMLEAYPWPGNNREMESFIVQAVTSCRGPSLSPDHLPRRVLGLLDPSEDTFAFTDAFETVVEDRLRELVANFSPLPDSPHLHRIVIDSTERALFRLALQRTRGNQKAAAELLGLARNTLRSKLQRLELDD